MAEIVEIAAQKYWKNQAGQLVPENQVKGEDQERDDLVGRIVRRWEEQQAELKELKSWFYGEVSAYLELLQERYGAEERQAEGITLTDYSGKYRLVVKINRMIDFGAELTVAKQLIDACLDRWSQGADVKLVTVVKDAFRVNQEGKVSIPRILGLKRLEINDDEEWGRAMQAISDAVTVTHTKKYINLYRRDEQEGKWKAIPLDLAAL